MWPIPVGRIAFLNPNSSDSPRRWTVSPKTSVNRSTAASRSLTTTVSSTMSPSMAPPYGVGGDHTVESGASTAELRGDLTTMPKRWALSVPLDGFTLAEHAELAREAERLGYTDAWSLEGERVVFRGETFAVDGFRLTKPPVEPVPIHIAALRPGMLRVAGEVGDGAILNWLAADDVPKSVAVVREAAARAGRDPGAIEITARLLVNAAPPAPAAG